MKSPLKLTVGLALLATTHAFDFATAFDKVKDLAQATTVRFQNATSGIQDRVQAVDWEAVRADAEAAFNNAKEMAVTAKDKVQATNWTEVEYQAKLALNVAKDMAEKGVEASKATVDHLKAVNWTEVGEGLSAAGSASGSALKDASNSAAASATAAAHSASALGHTVKIFEGLGKATSAITNPSESDSLASEGHATGVPLALPAALLLLALAAVHAKRAATVARPML